MARLTMSTIVCTLGLLPALAAEGALFVHIEDKEVVPAAGGGTLMLEVTFLDSFAISFLDDLYAYDLGFVLEKVGGGAGDVRFAAPYAERPDDFVFSGAATFDVDRDATATGFLLHVFDPTARRVDITADPVGAARLVLEYGPATPPGEYRVRLDPALTGLLPGAEGPEMLFPDLTDVGVIRLVPEPGGVSVLAVGGLVALRRRRRAS